MSRASKQRETTIHGNYDPQWGPVVQAFADGVNHETGGAALSIWRHGAEVLNVYAGTADRRSGQPWRADTRAVLFSSTKGLAALAVAWLEDQGHLALDDRVARLWPEFATNGKQDLTIGDVLAHRAGLPAPEEPITLDELVDIRAFAARLAAQEPMWPNANCHLYHAVTWGPLVSEIVRRATGEDITDIFAKAFALPLGADVSLAATTRDLPRTAYVTSSTDLADATKTISKLGDLAVSGLTAGGALPLGLVGEGTGYNDPRVLCSGLVSGAGTATASGLAQIWSSLVCPPDSRPLSGRAIDRLTQVRSEGPGFGDTSNGGFAMRWGAGVQLSSSALPLMSDESFGHDGAGGQCGFADPRYGIGFGYVTNRMAKLPPAAPIIAATRAVLD